MENTVHSDELQHWGIKGQKWGQRRYQNKDGSLTPLGQKRYNKEVEKLKKETAKVKEAEKAAANRKKTQSKLDKLEEKKQALEERKKALKGDTDGKKKEDKHPEETPEQRRERLLKSTNPKELYEGKDDLSYQELNERIMRIDLENRLQSKIPAEPTKEQKTAAEYMDKAKSAINSASALYKSVDDAYSTFANSSIAKIMGLDLPTGKDKPKAFNAEEFLAKVRSNKATTKEIQEGTNALKNINTAEQQMKQIEKMNNDSKSGKKQKKGQSNDQDSNTDQNQNKGKDQNQNKGKDQNQNKGKDQNPKQETKKEAEQTEKVKATSNAKEQNADVNEKIRKAADALDEAAKKSSDNAETVEKSTYELQKQVEEMIDKYGDFWLPM